MLISSATRDAGALALLASLIVWIAPSLQGAMLDDGLIYLRIAENINNGLGWVYNEQEHVNPATSPLFVMLLSVLALFLEGESALLVLYCLGLFGILYAFAWLQGARKSLTALLMLVVAQVTVYSTMGAPSGYFWYYTLLLMALNLFMVVAVFGLVRSGLSLLESQMRHDTLRFATTNAVVLAALASGLLILMLNHLALGFLRMPQDYRLAAEYRQVAQWIRDNADESVEVAATEIGYIGYVSQRRIRDIHGLLHADVYHDINAGRWSWWYERQPLPEFVVVHEPRWIGEPADASWWPPALYTDFQSRYVQALAINQVVLYQKAR